MKMKTMLMSAAAVSLAATPIAAQAVDADRSAAPVEGEAELGAAGPFGALLVVAAILAVGVIAHLITDDGDDFPTSP